MIRISIVAKLTADASAILFSQPSTINSALVTGHMSLVTSLLREQVGAITRPATAPIVCPILVCRRAAWLTAIARPL